MEVNKRAIVLFARSESLFVLRRSVISTIVTTTNFSSLEPAGRLTHRFFVRRRAPCPIRRRDLLLELVAFPVESTTLSSETILSACSPGNMSWSVRPMSWFRSLPRSSQAASLMKTNRDGIVLDDHRFGNAIHKPVKEIMRPMGGRFGRRWFMDTTTQIGEALISHWRKPPLGCTT